MRVATDKCILGMVQGSQIDFFQTQPSHNPSFSELKNEWINQEINNLLGKKYIKRSHHEKGKYIYYSFFW